MKRAAGARTVAGAMTTTQAITSPRSRLLAGLDADERRFDAAGVGTVVLESGQGPPLVLLHGGIECGGAVWAPAIPALAATHRVVVPDLPGLGESEPAERLDASNFERWLQALLAATCDEPPVVVAHSLTGGLAARFAARNGARLRGLVIYASPAVGPYRVPLGLRVVALRFGLRPTKANAERFERFAFLDLDVARRRDPEWFAAFSEYSRLRAAVPHVKRAMAQLLKAGTKQVPDSELRRIEAPAALLWGRHDRFVPLALGEAAATRLNWPLRVIDRAGHVPHIEQREAWLDALQTQRRSTA